MLLSFLLCNFLVRMLKSVHFKNAVARCSFHSKIWPFLLKSKQSQLMLYWKWPQFWKKWGLRNCVLKMNGLYLLNCFLADGWKLARSRNHPVIGVCLYFHVFVHYILNLFEVWPAWAWSAWMWPSWGFPGMGLPTYATELAGHGLLTVVSLGIFTRIWE